MEPRGSASEEPAGRKQARCRLASPDPESFTYGKKDTGNRGNDAADKLAKMGAEIEEGHRVVERGSAEPPLGRDEHKDNG